MNVFTGHKLISHQMSSGTVGAKEVEKQSTDPREKLRKEMEELRTSTLSDGSVEAEILDIYPENEDNITVEIDLPNGKILTHQFSKPDDTTEENEFVRFCRANGATIDTFDELLIGSTITVKREQDEWIIPTPYTSMNKRIKHKISSVRKTSKEDNDRRFSTPAHFLLGTILYPLLFLNGFFCLIIGDEDDKARIYDMGAFHGGLITFLMFFSIFLIFILL